MTFRSLIIVGASLSLTVMASACRENKFGVVDLTIPEDPIEEYTRVTYNYTYQHPCCMWTQKDYDRVKNSLDNNTAPQAVKDEFKTLSNSAYVSKTYVPSPTIQIVRGDEKGTGYTPAEASASCYSAQKDASAAYQMALLWKLTGDNGYADAVVKILNAWASTCERVTSNDSNHKLLAAQGYTFIMAAEILCTYEGWSSENLRKFKEWTIKVWLPVCRDFLDRHQGQCDDHYWSNWDLVNMCCYLAMGILNENDEMVNYVVNYFHDGNDMGVKGNGYIKKLIVAYHTNPLDAGDIIGQNQESGRDQGHAQMSASVTALMAQMAYALYTVNTDKPELDFFAANNNALMAMGEYVAISNLRNGTDQENKSGSWLIDTQKIPFETYYYCGGANHEGPDCKCSNKSHGATHTCVSNDDGRGSLRPGWDIYYMHYAKVKGLKSGFKYIRQAADKIRPECGPDGSSRYGTNSGAFDQTGWNTLMMYQE
ncbi:MAG: alginate lyase family protein [Bacteroidaceae bacterium]|nr:alginate lyase family protein [Bacteroidaceae bacterium]